MQNNHSKEEILRPYSLRNKGGGNEHVNSHMKRRECS